MIYFLRTPSGAIKVGKADDVPSRIVQLEREFGAPLVLLAVKPGSYPEENEIRRRFSHLRFPRSEQYRPTPELFEFIGIPVPTDNGDVIAKSPKRRTLLFELPEDTHKLLRIEAARQDVSLASLARVAVEDYLKRKAGGR